MPWRSFVAAKLGHTFGRESNCSLAGVFRSGLDGPACFKLRAGGVWNNAASNLVSVSLRKMLAFTVSGAWLPDESWGDYLHRICHKVSELCDRWSFLSVEAFGVRHRVGWIGHMLRQSSCCPAVFLTSWRGILWRDIVKHLFSGRPRYLVRGAPQTPSTDSLSENLGRTGSWWSRTGNSGDSCR